MINNKKIIMVMPAYNAGKTPLQDDHKIHIYAFILGFARLGSYTDFYAIAFL